MPRLLTLTRHQMKLKFVFVACSVRELSSFSPYVFGKQYRSDECLCTDCLHTWTTVKIPEGSTRQERSSIHPKFNMTCCSRKCLWCIKWITAFLRWAATWQNQQNECVPIEDSDHPPRLTRVFVVRSMVAKDPSFLYADSEDSDQTGRIPRLIWDFVGRILILLVLSCRGSYHLHSPTVTILGCLLLALHRWVSQTCVLG